MVNVILSNGLILSYCNIKQFSISSFSFTNNSNTRILMQLKDYMISKTPMCIYKTSSEYQCSDSIHLKAIRGRSQWPDASKLPSICTRSINEIITIL